MLKKWSRMKEDDKRSVKNNNGHRRGGTSADMCRNTIIFSKLLPRGVRGGDNNV